MTDDKLQLSPDRVVLDIVLRYGDKPVRGAFVYILTNKAVMLMSNHRGEPVQVMIPFHLEGEPEDDPVRFVITKLGPTVWKLAPSITVVGMLHAYVTVVGVPEPAPWEPR